MACTHISHKSVYRSRAIGTMVKDDSFGKKGEEEWTLCRVLYTFSSSPIVHQDAWFVSELATARLPRPKWGLKKSYTIPSV